ncbi:MAG: efflux RND transporter permease subunit [Saprospiraceae bacterium]
MSTVHYQYRNPLYAIALLLLLIGAFTYTRNKTGLFPDITFPKIKVIIDAGQQPVDKMMTTVTVPVENIIKRTQGLDYIRSITSRGSCEISVYLKWNTDIDQARQQIEALISEIQSELLPDTKVTVEKMNPSTLAVMGYSLEGNRSQVELKKIALLQVKPHLASTPGVSDVAIIGGKTKEYQIVLKPDRLSTLGISLSTIQSAVTESNILKSNGYISDHNRLYLTLTDNSVNNLTELQNLILQNTSKRLVRLRDVADVIVTEAKEYIKINANGKDVPLVAVFKQPDANLIEVNNGVELRVKELENILPKDVKLIPYYKQAEFVNDSITSIRDVLLIGLALAMFVVIIFLRSISSSIAVLFTIPITLAVTCTALYLFGYTFNIMTLGAIAAALGLMIDDAVILVEQIHRMREEQPDEEIQHILSRSIKYLLPSMIGSSLSTIVIFIPFSLMSGIAGAYFKIMAYTMIITLSSSFLVTWLILPTLFLLIPLRKKKLPVETVTRSAWINFFILKPYIALLLIAGCTFLIWYVPPMLESGFLPDMDEGSIVLDFESPPGTTLEETDRLLQQVDHILQEQPEVEKFSRRLGTEMGFFITEPNKGDYLIQLKKERELETEQVSNLIRSKIEHSIPQLRVDFGQIIGDMLGDLMSSVQPIEIKIFGSNRSTLDDLSRQIADEVSEVPGTADVFNGIVIAGPEVNLQPDVAKLAQLGLTANDFQFQMQSQIEGSVISSILDVEQRLNIRMIYPGALQTNVHTLEQASIFLPNGMMKPVSTIATIELGKGVAQIIRENQKMIGVVTAGLDNRDLGHTLADIKSRLQEKINLPPAYHIEYGGSYAQQQQAFKELLIILLTAVLLVFIVILFLFRRIGIAILIILLATLGAAGCLTALLVTGTALNVGSYMGIIMIVGIIAENAIFTYQQYHEALKTMTRDEAIHFAISTRLRPKLMTASAAIIALFPLALGIGVGAQLHRPLAIAVIGGLVLALPLLLIVLPSMLRLFRAR